MTERKKMIPVTYYVCDFCGKELTSESEAEGECAMCQKDICLDHTGQSEEDGILCVECSKVYEIKYSQDDGVGVRNKKTRKYVDNHL